MWGKAVSTNIAFLTGRVFFMTAKTWGEFRLAIALDAGLHCTGCAGAAEGRSPGAAFVASLLAKTCEKFCSPLRAKLVGIGRNKVHKKFASHRDAIWKAADKKRYKELKENKCCKAN